MQGSGEVLTDRGLAWPWGFAGASSSPSPKRGVRERQGLSKSGTLPGCQYRFLEFTAFTKHWNDGFTMYYFTISEKQETHCKV